MRNAFDGFCARIYLSKRCEPNDILLYTRQSSARTWLDARKNVSDRFLRTFIDTVITHHKSRCVIDVIAKFSHTIIIILWSLLWFQWRSVLYVGTFVACFVEFRSRRSESRRRYASSPGIRRVFDRATTTGVSTRLLPRGVRPNVFLSDRSLSTIF